MSLANNGAKRFHQWRTVSWLMSMPRSASRSSTFLRLSGYFTYIITARRITSGEELKWRNGLAGLRGRGMDGPYPQILTQKCIWSDRVPVTVRRAAAQQAAALASRPLKE
jgi:hypothetical protein